MRMDKAGISVYKDLTKNSHLYSNINERAEFKFDEGAIVEYYSNIPDSVCNIKMIEMDTGDIHYETDITTGMFAKSNRKEISPLIIIATNKFGKELLFINLKNWAKSI